MPGLSRGTRASKGFTVLTVGLASFTDALLYGIGIPVLPFVLPKLFGLPEDDVQRWNAILTEVFGGTIAVGAVLVGWVNDLAPSRQAPFVLGLLALGGSTLLFTLARSLPVLVVARVLQGLSTAVAETVGSAMLLDKVGQDSIGEALGWKGLASTVGFFAGPLVGGVLYDSAGYFAVYMPVFVLLAVELVLRVLVIEDRREGYSDARGDGQRKEQTEEQQQPEQNQPLLTRHASDDSQTTTYGTSDLEQSTESTFDPPSKKMASKTACSPPAPAGGRSTNGHSRNATDGEIKDEEQEARGQTSRFGFPILKLLCLPRLLVALIGLMIQNSFAAALEIVIPLYFHELFGLTSSQAALTLIPFTIPLLFSPYAGRAVDRAGNVKWPAAINSAACVPLTALMALVTRDTLGHLILALALTFLLGCARIVAMPALAKELTEAVKDLGARKPASLPQGGVFALVYGLNNSTSALGLMAGTFYGASIREGLGWQAMSFAMAALSFVVTVPIVLVTGGGVSRLRWWRGRLEEA